MILVEPFGAVGLVFVELLVSWLGIVVVSELRGDHVGAGEEFRLQFMQVLTSLLQRCCGCPVLARRRQEGLDLGSRERLNQIEIVRLWRVEVRLFDEVVVWVVRREHAQIRLDRPRERRIASELLLNLYLYLPVREISVQRWTNVSWIRLQWTHQFVHSRTGTCLIEQILPHAAAVNRAPRPFISRSGDGLRRDSHLLLHSDPAHRCAAAKSREIHIDLLIRNRLRSLVEWIRNCGLFKQPALYDA